MIGEATRPKTPRRPTRPGRGAVERRLDEKRQVSARKRARRAPGDDA
jgi:ribosome-associated protein